MTDSPKGLGCNAEIGKVLSNTRDSHCELNRKNVGIFEEETNIRASLAVRRWEIGHLDITESIDWKGCLHSKFEGVAAFSGDSVGIRNHRW